MIDKFKGNSHGLIEPRGTEENHENLVRIASIPAEI
jgi:hypothetical protein